MDVFECFASQYLCHSLYAVCSATYLPLSLYSIYPEFPEPSLGAATVRWLRWVHNPGVATAHGNGIHTLGLPADMPIAVYVHSFQWRVWRFGI